MSKVKVKFNIDLRGYKKGDTKVIDDTDAYWSRRLKEAKQDKSLVIVTAKAEKAGETSRGQ